jgi:hypothetical protein
LSVVLLSSIAQKSEKNEFPAVYDRICAVY